MWKPKFNPSNLIVKRTPVIQPSLHFERMEPKILLSADALGGLLATDPFQSDSDHSQPLDFSQSVALLNDSSGAEKDNESFTLDALAQAINDSRGNDSDGALDGLSALIGEPDSIDSPRQEIIFVDAATPDYQQLIEGISRDAQTQYQVVILQSGLNGIEQITTSLGQQQGIDAIHLVSHGNASGLQLGNVWLTDNNLDNYQQSLQLWQASLTQDADLLIYGCDLASTEAGQSLLNSLAELTTADVAASDDATGNAALGGDWTLEYHQGDIEAALAFGITTQQDWGHVLGKIGVTTFNDVVDGDANTTSLAALALTPGSDGFVSLREALIAANTDGAADEIILAAGTYSLTIAGSDDTSLLGDLDILDDLIIRGDSAVNSIIDGAGIAENMFDIRSNNVEFFDLTLTNAVESVGGNGGAITVFTGRDITLTDVVISNNQSVFGGGIYNAGGTVVLNQVLFSGNTAGFGGAILNASNSTIIGTDVDFSSNSATTSGGAIYNAESLTLDRVLFFDNTAVAGGAILNAGEAGNVVNLTNATFCANTGTTDGGAIYNLNNANPGLLNITHSTFTENTSPGSNGIFQDATSIVNI